MVASQTKPGGRTEKCSTAANGRQPAAGRRKSPSCATLARRISGCPGASANSKYLAAQGGSAVSSSGENRPVRGLGPARAAASSRSTARSVSRRQIARPMATAPAALAAIPPGEGRVLTLAGERLAVYRNGNGQLGAPLARRRSVAIGRSVAHW